MDKKYRNQQLYFRIIVIYYRIFRKRLTKNLVNVILDLLPVIGIFLRGGAWIYDNDPGIRLCSTDYASIIS